MPTRSSSKARATGNASGQAVAGRGPKRPAPRGRRHERGGTGDRRSRSQVIDDQRPSGDLGQGCEKPWVMLLRSDRPGLLFVHCLLHDSSARQEARGKLTVAARAEMQRKAPYRQCLRHEQALTVFRIVTNDLEHESVGVEPIRRVVLAVFREIAWLVKDLSLLCTSPFACFSNGCTTRHYECNVMKASPVT
jgi:hypothetical protein